MDADVIFVGAGCAGLSLAWHLVHDRDVLLIDPRTEYGRDRTWCFWNVVDHPFEHLVTHRWPRWRVRDHRWIERGAPGLEYQHLPSDVFYRAALERLRDRVRLGVRAFAVRTEDGCAAVETDQGTLRARVIFDSRPTTPRAAPLLQHFEGWFVEGGRFDPSTATLMDFAVDQTHGVHFFYVLPFAHDRALVEATWFGVHPLDDYRSSIERYLERTLGVARYTIVHRERGVLPMSIDAPQIRVSERVYRIGLAGGMAKPSTGYAFQAIQRFSIAMANAMRRDELPDPPPPRPWHMLALDRIFLSYVARHPERAPAMLAQLFERVDPLTLARFLSDASSPAETLRAMAAMPFAPLGAETFRAARLWLRR